MLGLVVHFKLKDGMAGEFDRLAEGTLALIRAREPGTLVYAVHDVEGDPLARVFYELYRDRAAFEAHERQEHVRRFLAERERCLAAPPQVEWLRLRSGTGIPAGE